VSDTQLRRIHVDGDVEAKLLSHRLTPEIPHEAQVANVAGTVVLHAVIDRNGRTREIQYVSGPSLLAQAAIDAVRWWEYEVDVEDVEIDTTIEVGFSPADI
jgi:outer membrane biosynthesis protein TonB